MSPIKEPVKRKNAYGFHGAFLLFFWGPMRISQLTKFVLLSLVVGIVLVGIMIGMIQFYAFQNFSDYVTQMEYGQLDDLSRILWEKYQENGS